MNTLPTFIAFSLLLGVLATALADAWAEVQKRVFNVPSPSWPMVGRWVGHLRHGQFKHASIAKRPPSRAKHCWAGSLIT
nr:DUF2938 family protein [Pseudomonas brassicae]